MFIALEITEMKPGGLLSGLRSFFTTPEVYVEQRSHMGARFMVIKTRSGRKGIDWDKVEDACGFYSDRVLLPDNVTIPDGYNFRSPSLAKFKEKVLVRTACEIISRTRMPMYLRVLGLIDLDGTYANMLSPLLMHFSSVRVVTNNEAIYSTQAERMMEELGAPVMVSGQTSALSGCALILSPAGFYTDQEAAFNCPVIADGPFEMPGRINIATSLRVDSGERVLEICPTGIDPHMFAGALYEYCGLDSVATAADTVLYNYRATELSEVVRSVILGVGLNPRMI